MAEQQHDDPGLDVLARGLGEQHHAARLEHAVELGDRLLLLHQVVEGLVAKQEVDRVAGQRQARACRRDERGPGPFLRRCRGRNAQHAGIDVDAHQHLGRETILQFAQRPARAATHIDDDAIRRAAPGDQPHQVGHRTLEHVHRPGFGPQEPLPETGLGNVRSVVGQLLASAVRIASFSSSAQRL